MQHLGDAQRVQHMVWIEVLDVLARDDVDLCVPLEVEVIERIKLLLLSLCQPCEIVGNYVAV